jgi:superfamily I DNA and/or RNA helicase
MQPVLEGQQFDVVILDECSQMTEPVSLIPLLQARCRLLVAAGDPCQLPPVIASPVHVTPGPGQGQGQGQGQGAPQGLLRPLFRRLAELGHSTFLLRRQYRCHPLLSAVPNSCFYQGESNESSPLPPLLHCLAERAASKPMRGAWPRV